MNVNFARYKEHRDLNYALLLFETVQKGATSNLRKAKNFNMYMCVGSAPVSEVNLQ